MFCVQKVSIADDKELKVDDLEHLPPRKLLKKSSTIISEEEIEEDRCYDTSLDWCGRFKDPQLQEEYILSCVHQKSRKSYLLLSFFILGWAAAETTAYSWLYFDKGTIDLAGLFSILLLVVAFSLSLFIHGNEQSQINSEYYRGQMKLRSRLQVGFIILLNFVFFLKIILRIEDNHACIPESLHLLHRIDQDLDNALTPPHVLESIHHIIKSMSCPSDDSIVSRSCIGTILLMSICPQLLIAILYEPRTYLILPCHFVATALLLVISVNTVYLILPLTVSSLVIAVLLFELHLQRVQSFLRNRQLQQVLYDREKNADAVHAMEMRHMIGNVAHDLKTPLSSFTNGLDLIKDILTSANEKVVSDLRTGNPLTEEMFREHFSSVNNCIQNIRNTTSFMLMTINRCIDYTKASKGMKLVPKYETVDLREALQFPIECMINIQERIGITLSPLSEKICRFIITDKQWLQENLLCLLSNAVKYSTEGNVTINAHFSSAAIINPSLESKSISIAESYLVFEIEDTGIGLSEEAMMNLFNPFKQAQRLAGGTGLGLYSLAKRMEALKGNYGVRKRKDGKQGSLFWFSIPYKEDQMTAGLFKDKDSSLRIRYTPSNDEIIRALGSLQVLVVDDSPSILKMSSMMLKRQGHKIRTAENGEIALKRIEEKWRETGKGFDLVLMDLQMPVMDGLEAIRRLRKMEVEGREWMNNNEKLGRNGRRQLIFGVSANSDHETMQEAFQAGFDDFIGKPFSVEMFNNTIQKHLLHPRS